MGEEKNILDIVTDALSAIDDFMYYPVLLIVLALAGIIFTILTNGV